MSAISLGFYEMVILDLLFHSCKKHDVQFMISLSGLAFLCHLVNNVPVTQFELYLLPKISKHIKKLLQICYLLLIVDSKNTYKMETFYNMKMCGALIYKIYLNYSIFV